MKQYQNILMFILPFSNEIANALTISQTLKNTRFKRLYKPCDENINFKIKSAIIDFIALIGICWNVGYMGSKHGTKASLFYGSIVITLSFIVPNLFMEKFVNLLGKNRINIPKISMCIIFIMILLFLELIFCNLIKSMNWKYNRFSYK